MTDGSISDLAWLAVPGTAFAAHLVLVWSAFQPWGVSDGILMFVNLGAALVGLMVVLVGVVGLLTLLVRFVMRRRPYASTFVRAGLISVGVLITDISLYRVVHDSGVRHIISRGDRIVAAIERFQMERGTAPESLEQLVPTYLPEVPVTGAAIGPTFAYARDATTWSLAVSLTQWILDDTRLLYNSDMRYGQCAVRYGRWAVSACG